jgi:hypothetical protein
MDGILTLARMLDENGRVIPLQKVVDYGMVKHGSVAPAGWGIGRDEICLGPNLVVDGGRQMMAYLLGNKSPTSDFVISTFKVGTGTTAPTVADTGLQNSVLSKAIEGVDYPSPFVLRVEMQLGPSEANGYLLTEFGLFSGNGTMIARKTQVGLSKSAGLSPVCFWRLRL